MNSASRRVAVVTGAASGIGAACALELARRGWRVLVNYRSSGDAARQTAVQCIGAGGEARTVQGDVAEDADCRRMAQLALDLWGRIDALVNNAGTTRFVAHSNLEELNASDFMRIYRVNVVGAFQMTRACAPALAASGRGAVVNVSSLAALMGTGSSIAYAASKGALNTMTVSLARVLGPQVRVNAVAPGFTDTPWLSAGYGEARYAELAKRYARHAFTGSMARPEDIADAVAWLIEGARQVTGETIFVDGGMHNATPR